MMNWFRTAWLACILLSPALASAGADGFELPPIEYSSAKPANPIEDLRTKVEAGAAKLRYEEPTGWLRSVLHELKVPIESQVLVFSQTSLQRHRISPETPRALYFNDDLYIGYCQAGEVMEISTSDPKLGTVFYTLAQDDSSKPKFTRQVDQCLQCHQSSRTDGVPGHQIRSLFVDPRGQPIFSGGSYTVDHTTPIENRWGGWYVTGTHGAQKHLGNLIVRTREVPAVVDNSAGQNVVQLSDYFVTKNYLSPHSDVVALMVLEHQALVHNRITKANFSCRQALQSDGEMRKILSTPGDELLESTRRRIQNVAEDLVEALLFVDEAKLTERVRGTSGFESVFAAGGTRDSRGRSLRDFDLTRRMFKYPCSYLIESQAFRSLPTEVRDVVWDRLWEVLAEGADAKKLSNLSPDDRAAIVEILRETHPDVPQSWKAPAATATP